LGRKVFRGKHRTIHQSCGKPCGSEWAEAVKLAASKELDAIAQISGLSITI
jgi:hypothetical protein